MRNHWRKTLTVLVGLSLALTVAVASADGALDTPTVPPCHSARCH